MKTDIKSQSKNMSNSDKREYGEQFGNPSLSSDSELSVSDDSDNSSNSRQIDIFEDFDDPDPALGPVSSPASEDDEDDADHRRKRTIIIAVVSVLAVIVAAIVLLAVLLSKQYLLTIKNGEGGGSYKAGTKIAVKAQEITGKVFSGWTASGIELVDDDITSSEIVISMPRNKVELEAGYQDVEYSLSVLSGSGSGDYLYDDAVIIEADEPEPGFEFQNWEVTEGNLRIKDPRSSLIEINMPAEDVTINAVYQQILYRLSVNDSEENAGFYYGDEVVLVAEDRDNYTFIGWKVEKGELSIPQKALAEKRLSFIMPAQDVSLTSVYQLNEHKATVSDGSGTGTYAVGTTVKLTANAAQKGYEFKNWTVLLGKPEIENSTLPETIFVMPDQDVSIKAEFSRISYPLSVKGTGGSGEYAFGDEVTLTAEERTNYSFTGWIVDKGGLSLTEEELAENDITFTMPAQDVSLTATYQINEHKAVITGGSGTGTYAVGDIVKLTANVAQTGYEFSEWSVLKGKPDIENAGLPETSFVMPDQDVNIKASYNQLFYLLSVKDAEGSGEYGFGDEVTLTAEDKDNYTFAGWRVKKGKLELTNEELGAKELTFTMPAQDVSLDAIYQLNEHKAEVTGGSGTGTYTVGTTVKLVAEAAQTGYEFSNWSILQGKPDIENAELPETSFIMPDQDIKIRADYNHLAYKLVVKNGEGSDSYCYGDPVSIIADKPEDGMVFSHWTVDQGTLELSDSTLEEITFEMLPEDLKITAHFAIPQRELTVIDGNGDGSYEVGTEVKITAETLDAEGNAFEYWSVDKGKLDLNEEDITKEVLSFQMPDNDLTLKANYRQKGSDFALKVNGGTGSGTYEAGTKITVQADTPDPGMTFVKWFISGYPDSISEKNSTIEITMPENDVEITALFQSIQ